MALAQPVSVVDDRCRAGFDAAVIAVDRLVPADRRGLEAVGLLLFDKHLNILAQGALVVLERENIVSPFVEDLARDGALAPHRVNGHDGAVDRQHVQQFRDRHDLVRLLRHLDLAEHQPSRRRKPYGWRLSCPFPDTSGAPSCRRSRSPRPARRSATPPRRRNSAETSPHRAWRRYRRADHATACHRQTTGTGAEARASSSRSGRFPRSSRPPPGPPAGTAAAPHQAGRSPCHAARQRPEMIQKNNRFTQSTRRVHHATPLPNRWRPMDSEPYPVVTHSFTRLPWYDPAVVWHHCPLTAMLNGRYT